MEQTKAIAIPIAIAVHPSGFKYSQAPMHHAAIKTIETTNSTRSAVERGATGSPFSFAGRSFGAIPSTWPGTPAAASTPEHNP